MANWKPKLIAWHCETCRATGELDPILRDNIKKDVWRFMHDATEAHGMASPDCKSIRIWPGPLPLTAEEEQEKLVWLTQIT